MLAVAGVCLLVGVLLVSASARLSSAPASVQRLLAGGTGAPPASTLLAPSVGGSRPTPSSPIGGSELPLTSVTQAPAPTVSGVSSSVPHLQAPVIAAVRQAGAAISGPLHTQGNDIIDAQGVSLIPRGVVSDWLDWQPSISNGSPLSDASVAQMKSWGANTVRLLLSESYWDVGDCLYVPSYAATVDEVVQSITSRGMVAVLDLHNNGRTPCEASNQQRMADNPGSVQFWQSVAARYMTNPLVAFDLYNEPHDITWSQWLNGGSLVDRDGIAWQAAGMQQLYNTIRGQGALNLVFVSGNNWAATPPPESSLVKGFNIVYAAHEYTCPHTLPPACITPHPYNPAPPGQGLDVWSSFLLGHPTVVTEFGWPDPQSGTFNQNVIDWAKSKNVGWTAYGWAPGGVAGTTAAFGFLKNLTTYDPLASGVPVKNTLQQYLLGPP
jgi:hypothetical protein